VENRVLTKKRNRISEAFETHLFSEDDFLSFHVETVFFFSSREGIIAEFRAAAQADTEIAAWGKKVTVTFGLAFFQQILRYTPAHLLPDLSPGMRMWMSDVLVQLLSPYQPTYCKQSPKKSAVIIRKSVGGQKLVVSLCGSTKCYIQLEVLSLFLYNVCTVTKYENLLDSYN
jgi:hypothetical protein